MPPFAPTSVLTGPKGNKAYIPHLAYTPELDLGTAYCVAAKAKKVAPIGATLEAKVPTAMPGSSPSDAPLGAPEVKEEPGEDSDGVVEGLSEPSLPEPEAEPDKVMIDDSDDDGAVLTNRKRRRLRAEATSLSHMMTHSVFNPYCTHCVRANKNRKGCRRTKPTDVIRPKNGAK